MLGKGVFRGRSMLPILVVKARLLRGAWVRALAVLLSGALGGALAFQRGQGPTGAGAIGAASVRPAPGPVASVSGLGAAPPERAANEADQACLARRAALWQVPEVALPSVDAPQLRAQL